MPSVEECIWNHARPLQDALHCVTAAKIQVKGRSLNVDHAVTFQHGLEVTLRRSDHRSSLLLAVTQGYRILRNSEVGEQPDFRLTITLYYYTIMSIDGREIVSFQWHPNSGGVDSPHLHIGSLMIDTNRHDLGRRFSRLHLPTSRVSIEQVIEALITQFDLTPMRADWRSVLDEGLGAFTQSRTWA